MVNAVKQGWIAFLLATGLVLALVCLSFQAGQSSVPGRLAGDSPAHVGMDHSGMSHAEMGLAPTSLTGAEALQASASHPCCPPTQMDDLCVTLCMMASSFLAPSFVAADASATYQRVNWPAVSSDVTGLGEACEPPPPKFLV